MMYTNNDILTSEPIICLSYLKMYSKYLHGIKIQSTKTILE